MYCKINELLHLMDCPDGLIDLSQFLKTKYEEKILIYIYIMDIINTFKHNDTISHGYVSLDTAEGPCVGHWIWECAFFCHI